MDIDIDIDIDPNSLAAEITRKKVPQDLHDPAALQIKSERTYWYLSLIVKFRKNTWALELCKKVPEELPGPLILMLNSGGT